MVSRKQARRLALALPEAVEQDHHGRSSFRVANRIFATQRDDDHMNSLIAAEGARSIGASYRFLDRTAPPGASYRYRLQVVDLDGSRHWAASSTTR